MYRFIFISFFLFFQLYAQGQEAVSVTVRSITIEGNKKTLDYVILREVDFAVGDTILVPNLGKRFERSQNNLIRTSLFNLAEVNVKEWDSSVDMVDISINVKEAWFIYIVPIVELADRNFNVWWKEFNGSLSRLNLGVRTQHLNLTGNNDRLKFLAQFGFTPKFELEYGFPNINKRKTIGVNFNIFRSINNETGFINENNRLRFFKMDEMRMLRRNRISTSVFYRPNLYATHGFKLEYQDNLVSPLIGAELNRNYFLNGRVNQKFLSLLYEFKYDERDSRIYPLDGIFTEVVLEKNGFGFFGDIDQLTLLPLLAKHTKLTNWLTISNSVRGKVSLNRKQQPYYNNRGLGYGSKYVRGYELYVVDGQDYFLSQNSLKFRLLDKQFDLGKLMFIDQFRILPVRLYFSLNFDAGIVNEEFYFQNNDFTNRWLFGGGPALNLQLYNNFVYRFEVSRNHLGEVGFFLHNSVSF